MKKYASQFNELVVLAEKNGKRKRGGSINAVLKLIQDLADFEESIQEAVDAQEMTQNKEKIEAFLTDIDKMYEVLFDIAKGGIQHMRSERSGRVVEDEVEETEPIEETDEPSEELVERDVGRRGIDIDDLRQQMELRPRASVILDIPRIPRM